MDAQDASPTGRCRLPDDVLFLIFSEFRVYLNPKPTPGLFGIMIWTIGSYRTLSNICKASKQFKAIAQPLLYRFVLTSPYHKETDKLLGSLSADPQLGDLVKEFNLRYETEWPATSRKHAEWFRQARPRLNLPPELAEKIDAVLSLDDKFRRVDATGAFWLALMPNLQTLNLAMMGGAECTLALLKHAVETKDRASPGAHPFSTLQQASFRQPRSSGPHIYITSAEALFKLPSLKTLRTSRVEWIIRKSDEPFMLPEVDCPLEHLYTSESSMRPETVRSVLAGCKKLRTLDLGLKMDPLGFFPSSYDMGDILRAHGQNLEDVNVGFQYHAGSHVNRKGEWLTGEEYLAHKIGDLRGLARLKHFRLGLPTMRISSEAARPFGPRPPYLQLDEMFPSSLETLVLCCEFTDKERLAENLYSLVAASKTLLPRLSCIMVSAGVKLERDLESLGWTIKAPESGGTDGMLVMERVGSKNTFDSDFVFLGAH